MQFYVFLSKFYIFQTFLMKVLNIFFFNQSTFLRLIQIYGIVWALIANSETFLKKVQSW